MFDKLKEQPLLGLTLAIAAGYVLAHFAVRFIEDLPSDTSIAVLFWTAVVGGILFIYSKRHLLLASIRGHKQKTAWIVAIGVLISACNVGRVVTADLASSTTGGAAQARWAMVGLFDLVMYLWLACIVFALAKLLRTKTSSDTKLAMR